MHQVGDIVEGRGRLARHEREALAVDGKVALRSRHLPFRIGQPERTAWLTHMRAAVHSSPAAPADAQALIDYFESAATSLINQPR